MKKNFKPKPYQRVEQKATSEDDKSAHEANQMRRNSEKISIGTFHIFGASQDTQLQTFTVAFTREVKKNALYRELDVHFGECWSPDRLFKAWSPDATTKSELIHLSQPLALKDVRNIIRKSYKKALEASGCAA